MFKKVIALTLAFLLVLSLCSCAAEETTTEPQAATAAEVDILTDLGLTADTKESSQYTVQVNSNLYSLLDFTDTSEYDNAVRGLIDAPEVLDLTDAGGNVVWSQAAYSFLDDYETAPDTVNPGLWENTINNHA